MGTKRTRENLCNRFVRTSGKEKADSKRAWKNEKVEMIEDVIAAGKESLFYQKLRMEWKNSGTEEKFKEWLEDTLKEAKAEGRKDNWQEERKRKLEELGIKKFYRKDEDYFEDMLAERGIKEKKGTLTFKKAVEKESMSKSYEATVEKLKKKHGWDALGTERDNRDAIKSARHEADEMGIKKVSKEWTEELEKRKSEFKEKLEKLEEHMAKVERWENKVAEKSVEVEEDVRELGKSKDVQRVLEDREFIAAKEHERMAPIGMGGDEFIDSVDSWLSYGKRVTRRERLNKDELEGGDYDKTEESPYKYTREDRDDIVQKIANKWEFNIDVALDNISGAMKTAEKELLKQKKEMPKVTPSSSLMEDMQTYSSNVGNSLIPKAILKDYNSDSTATVSKNRNRLNLIVV